MEYVKFKSVTWYASMAPLLAGLFIATEPMHKMTDMATSVSAMFGDVSPFVLINTGIAGVGLRKAIGK